MTIRQVPLRAPVILLAVLYVSALIGVVASSMALAPGDQAPLIRGIDFNGTRAAVDYQENKLTIVNFWATWCEPCREEMPMLQRLEDEFREQGLRVLGPMLDNVTDEQGLQFIEHNEVRYLAFRARRNTEKVWGISIFPTTFLINTEGRILRRYVGLTPESMAGMERDIRDLMAGRPLQGMVIPEAGSGVTDADRRRQKAAAEHDH